MPRLVSKRSLSKCEKYIYMLVSNVSVVYFRFEAWIKRWQSINTFVSVDVVLLVGFSPSVGRSQLWDNSCHNLGSYAGTARLDQLCWNSCAGAAMLRLLWWAATLKQLWYCKCWCGPFRWLFSFYRRDRRHNAGFLTKGQLRLGCR